MVVWASLDPRRPQIVFYPKTQASLLEAAYLTRTPGTDAEVYLGVEFHTATVHLPDGTQPYQTTPGSFYLCQHKAPGYRSVRRWPDDVNAAQVKRVWGEWRFCEDDDKDVEMSLRVAPPQEYVLPAEMCAT
jgi:hypothetical protein